MSSGLLSPANASWNVSAASWLRRRASSSVAGRTRTVMTIEESSKTDRSNQSRAHLEPFVSPPERRGGGDLVVGVLPPPRCEVHAVLYGNVLRQSSPFHVNGGHAKRRGIPDVN